MVASTALATSRRERDEAQEFVETILARRASGPGRASRTPTRPGSADGLTRPDFGRSGGDAVLGVSAR